MEKAEELIQELEEELNEEEEESDLEEPTSKVLKENKKRKILLKGNYRKDKEY